MIAALLMMCVVPQAATAHEAPAPSKVELVDELRGINAELREAQATLDEDLVWDRTTSARAVSRAQVDFFAEDYAGAAGRLLQLIARPGFDQHPGYPEALAYLGESFIQLGLVKAGLRHLRDALQHPELSPTQFRLRLPRYYERLAEDGDLATARKLWLRSQALRTDAPLEKYVREARYQYAKVLFKGGAVAEANALFGAIDVDDARFLQARYFIGVLALSRGDELKAAAAFDDAFAEWRLGRKTPDKSWLEDIDTDGDKREVTDLFEDEDPEAALATDSEHARMGAVIQLAIARLSAARGDYDKASLHYRGVPPGDPDFAAALAEASFVLFKREEHAWCVRVVDQLLAGRDDDVSSAQLGLWRAQLLARATEFDAAHESYAALEVALNRRAEALESDINASKRIFPTAVLAWSAPNDANRARRLEAELVTQREALLEAQEMVATLETLAATSQLLPAAQQGRELHDRLRGRLIAFHKRLEQARAEAHPHEDDQPHGGGAPASRADVARIEAAALKLRHRIERFETQLGRIETSYRKRIAAVLSAEAPKLRRLKTALSGEVSRAERLSTAMRTTARANLDTYAAEAKFGQLDLAWWRKEAVNDRIRAAQRQRDDDMNKLSEDLPPGTETGDEDSTPSPADDSEPEAPEPAGDTEDQIAKVLP